MSAADKRYPNVRWQLDGFCLTSERAWRDALLVETIWRAAAPKLFRVLTLLQAVNAEQADAIWDKLTDALCEVGSLAPRIAEALRHMHATPETDNSEAWEAKLREALLLAQEINPVHDELFEWYWSLLTDADAVERYERANDRLRRALYPNE